MDVKQQHSKLNMKLLLNEALKHDPPTRLKQLRIHKIILKNHKTKSKKGEKKFWKVHFLKYFGQHWVIVLKRNQFLSKAFNRCNSWVSPVVEWLSVLTDIRTLTAEYWSPCETVSVFLLAGGYLRYFLVCPPAMLTWHKMHAIILNQKTSNKLTRNK